MELIINQKGIEYIFKYSKEDEHRLTNTHFYVTKNKYLADHKGIFFHRLVLNAKEGEIVDHINGDTLDNRRENLRFVTRSQNATNAKFDKNKYKYVLDCPNEKAFRVNIINNTKSFNNNYDAIIYSYNYIQNNDPDHHRDKRSLIEIAEDIPYLTYNLNNLGIEDMFKCLDCGAVFSRKSKLERHKSENCSDKKCAKCGGLFANMTKLREHSKDCEREEYSCDSCNYHSAYSSNMARHNRDYHSDNTNNGIDFYTKKEETNFGCKFCEFKSISQAGLHQHIHRLHKDENKKDKTIKCLECDLMYSSVKTMKIHMKLKHNL